ncbi:hypothetical protein DNTS_016547 [Danionella cerebrum]|uniref:Angiotensinogen n=1 Tax=Danionella cerebrum TaxID=2873325 RepID=A0A553R1I3_9TELE|nr:hypothetical protein DNTS_016547 [Danionella translucida]
MFFILLMVYCLSVGAATRVYVHPFNLFSSENISCEVIQTEEYKQLETVHPLTPLQDGSDPDPRPGSTTDNLKPLKNLTQRSAVLAELQNSLGLRMYQSLSRTHKDTNILLSPLNTFGALVTLYLGASKKTALSYQQLLGLNLESEQADCAYFIDGHTVLRTLQAISENMDESRNALKTLVWTFINRDADISKDFLHGTQDFSDDSFVRAVDFTQAGEAEVQVNNFIQKTSEGKVKGLFKSVTSKTDFLYASSVHFKAPYWISQVCCSELVSLLYWPSREKQVRLFYICSPRTNGGEPEATAPYWISQVCHSGLISLLYWSSLEIQVKLFYFSSPRTTVGKPEATAPYWISQVCDSGLISLLYWSSLEIQVKLFYFSSPRTTVGKPEATGNWRTALKPQDVGEQEFWTNENASVQVPFMTHTGDFLYLQDSARKCSIVKIGLSKKTHMLLVLPHGGTSLQDIEKPLLTIWPTWVRHLKEKYLELSLPRFSLTAVTDLRTVLSDMAVEKYLMGSDASFKRMSSKENFTVNKVLNKVMFEMTDGESELPNINDDGRVAHKVSINRPFIFAVVEENSNAIVMIGKINNPTNLTK